MTISPLPFLFTLVATTGNIPNPWRLVIAFAATICCFACGLTLFRRPKLSKSLAFAASFGCFATLLPYFIHHPAAALLGVIALITIGFTLFDFQIRPTTGSTSNHLERCRQRARWACLAIPLMVGCSMILTESNTVFSSIILVTASLIAQILFIHWFQERGTHRLILYCAALLFIGPPLISTIMGHSLEVILTISLLTFLLLPHNKTIPQRREQWWEVLLDHPARILLSSFLGLCLLGTLLLITPGAATSGSISLVDAAFTAVSAVCVTGLITLDTSVDFSTNGQFFILLLIQLGGLGIMSIATVALHAMGRRLSLQHERLLGSMTDTDHNDLIASLVDILIFTLIVETIGAIILAALFHATGDGIGQAAWRGLFTAISAFCNAGFALQSESLIPYQSNATILHITAILIILGGMAPATSLIIPKLLQRKPIPESARIALLTSIVLLVSGTCFILAFEWNGILKGLSIMDKLHNGWFQSVTLRTAGFNSVNLSTIANPTLLIMLCLMFIGGSPGGTAGGIKTTTIGILALTFWADIRNRGDVIVSNRKIRSATIKRAITIIAAGGVVWFIIILMLETTQQISARDLVFEATSALGTAGLTIGATPKLDEIGKIIIMLAMFAGRIGPMTLFMLLSNGQTPSASRCLDAKIPLT